MNRAFLIILAPAVLVAAGFVAAAALLGVRLKWAPFLVAGGGVLAALALIHMHRRRKARPSGS